MMVQPRRTAARSKPLAGSVQTRRPGRPARISREAIVRTTLDILRHTPVEAFTLKTLSDHLGTTTTAIYKYFDSREAVLTAVADEVCRRFRQPKPAADWQQTLRAWLWALSRHAQRYPVMPWIIGLNGKSPPEWVRMTAPVAVLLRNDVGLRGRALATACHLVTSVPVSLMRMLQAAPEFLRRESLPDLAAMQLQEDQRIALNEVQGMLPSLKRRQILEVAFGGLVGGIEALRRNAACERSAGITNSHAIPECTSQLNS